VEEYQNVDNRCMKLNGSERKVILLGVFDGLRSVIVEYNSKSVILGV
jgi:hypothetical protein